MGETAIRLNVRRNGTFLPDTRFLTLGTPEIVLRHDVQPKYCCPNLLGSHSEYPVILGGEGNESPRAIFKP